MRLVFTSYSGTPEFNQPDAWLERIEGYTGILENLAKNHEVVGIERINYEGKLVRNAVEYIFVDIGKRRIHFPVKLNGIIKSANPDVVFINGLLFPLQVIQLRWKLGKNVRLVIIHRSERPFKGIKRLLQLWADRYISNYLFPSENAAREWVQSKCISSESKIAEVMHGSSVFSMADKSQARKTLDIAGSLVFLWVGRLNTNKDPLLVINAFLELCKTNKDVSLYMIFQTQELLGEITKRLAEDPIAKSAVHLIGAIPHPGLQNWYNAADFIISASHYEGGGIAMVEAMSCGCIPVLTKIPAFISMTGKGRCGFLYEPGNQEQLLDQLGKACSSDINAERKKVLEQFGQHLSFHAIASKISNVIKDENSIDAKG